MGEGLYWDADGVTVFAELTGDLDPDDVIEREIAWRDFVATARAAVSARWRRAGALWRHGAAVLAQSGLHLLTLYEDSYARAHLTVAMRSDLEPPLEALARAGLHRVAVPVFARVARRYPLRTRTTAWTSAPWSPPVRTPDANLTTAPARNPETDR